jgi:putative ABC transport system permease protein
VIETVRVALTGLGANKLRSGLTILGLMIGVGSVIVLIAVGKGSGSAVQSEISALGANVLTVSPSTGLGGLGFRGGASSSSTSTGLTLADASALTHTFQAPDVKTAAPVVSASSVTLTEGSTTYEPTTFVGTTPAYETVENDSLAEGTWFTAAEEKSHARDLVIGPTVAEELFSGADPVGQTLEVNGTDFTVVGVTTSKGSDGSTDQDDVAIAPLTAVQDTLTGYGSVSEILVAANSANATTAAETEVTDILNTLDPETTGSTEANFEVVDQASELAASDSSSKVFTTLLAEVAAISLLVGGIGVMNIMLVSVTERTREIGIRKAVGARRGDILSQFLVEAVLVSVFGGLAGIAAGLVASQFTISGIKPEIAPYSIGLAFGASLLIGLFFGTYPATRAAAMAPIEALRFE